MSRQAEREVCDWLHFVRRSGGAGEFWAGEFRAHRGVWEMCDAALQLLRRQRVTEGEVLLGRARARLPAPGDVDLSVRSVLDRGYYGVLGYCFYCRDALDEADALMVRAHSAVAEAIGGRRFLTPLAYHCHEFHLHRARIARNRQRWREMHDHLAEARGMVEGRVPFCTLPDRSTVLLGDLQEFYASLGPLSDAEQHACRPVVDRDLGLRGFDRFASGIYLVPGFVYGYP